MCTLYSYWRGTPPQSQVAINLGLALQNTVGCIMRTARARLSSLSKPQANRSPPGRPPGSDGPSLPSRLRVRCKCLPQPTQRLSQPTREPTMAATCLALAGLALAGRPRVTLRTRGAAMRVVSNVEPCTEIFCNRAINMAHIQAVGFDMDYTLAEYCSETFDLLAYDGAVDKLAGMGYPEAIRGFEYDPAAYQRGLVLDKKRGNVLKMDRHKYVKVAYHGLTRLNSAERKAIYASSFETQVQSFVPPDYASVDTEFMLVDLALFCQLVDYKDRHPEAIAQSYAQIAKDIRHAVDLCHCDGVIKDAVAADPAKYHVLP